MIHMPADPPLARRLPPKVDVVAAVVWRGERFLAVKRPEGKPLAGFWEFPGGKVEPGERLVQTLARELAEELDLTVSPDEDAAPFTVKTHDYSHARVVLHFFHVAQWSGEPTPLEGHVLAWLTPREAASYPFLEADTEVVAALASPSAAPPAAPRQRP